MHAFNTLVAILSGIFLIRMVKVLGSSGAEDLVVAVCSKCERDGFLLELFIFLCLKKNNKKKKVKSFDAMTLSLLFLLESIFLYRII